MLNYLAVGVDEILLFNQSVYKQYYNWGGGGVVMETGRQYTDLKDPQFANNILGK